MLFPFPGDLPDPVIEAVFPESPALVDRFFTTSTTWDAHEEHWQWLVKLKIGLLRDSDTAAFHFNGLLVIQLVKNPPAMRETWVRSLGWEDTLEKEKSTYSSILAWRIQWTQ